MMPRHIERIKIKRVSRAVKRKMYIWTLPHTKFVAQQFECIWMLSCISGNKLHFPKTPLHVETCVNVVMSIPNIQIVFT